MSDVFLFAVVPYAAVALAVAGLVLRRRIPGRPVTARSSQLVEGRVLFWGSIPWHHAILGILGAHLAAAVVPRTWARLLGAPWRLWVLEVTGLGLAAVAIAGLAVLLVRRVRLPRPGAVDLAVLVLLLAQAGAGAFIAYALRWGSVWFLFTAAPWLASLARLAPDVSAMAVLPAVVKFHAVLAFVLVALVPFTKLVHVTSVPLHYLWRPPQLVLWLRPRRGEEVPP